MRRGSERPPATLPSPPEGERARDRGRRKPAAKRRASSADVARLAGVSRTTVSFVLNSAPGKSIPEATRQRVLAAARELAYVPDAAARTSALVKHTSIGFFIPHDGYVSSDAYVARVVEGMTPVLNKNRYRLVLRPIDPARPGYLEQARRVGVDGLVLMNLHERDGGLAELVEARFPVVVIGSVDGGAVAGRRVRQLDVDNRAAVAEAVQHLVDLGHRDIGMISHAPLSYAAARDRLDGYRATMARAGLRVRRDWVREADLTEESGRQAMAAILAGPRRPTAVFAGNDVVAYGALRAIEEAGLRVPDDLSLVGCDDDPLSRHLHPPLTTVVNPAVRLGAEAARLLIALLRGAAPPPRRTLFRTSLAVRGSSRPPRAAAGDHAA